jgi:hypothetical protein
MHRIHLAGQTEGAAKPICAALAGMDCSIASPLIKRDGGAWKRPSFGIARDRTKRTERSLVQKFRERRGVADQLMPASLGIFGCYVRGAIFEDSVPFELTATTFKLTPAELRVLLAIVQVGQIQHC